MFFRVALGLHCLVKKSGERKRIEAKKRIRKAKKGKRGSREAQKQRSGKNEEAEKGRRRMAIM